MTHRFVNFAHAVRERNAYGLENLLAVPPKTRRRKVYSLYFMHGTWHHATAGRDKILPASLGLIAPVRCVVRSPDALWGAQNILSGDAAQFAPHSNVGLPDRLKLADAVGRRPRHNALMIRIWGSRAFGARSPVFECFINQ